MAKKVILDQHGREFEPDRVGFKHSNDDRKTRDSSKPEGDNHDVRGERLWMPDYW
jgi:hypothetical protein